MMYWKRHFGSREHIVRVTVNWKRWGLGALLWYGSFDLYVGPLEVCFELGDGIPF